VKTPECLKFKEHGLMKLSTTTIRWERGFGKAKFPLTTELCNVPAYVCEACEKIGKNTFILDPAFDKDLTENILHPINKVISNHLRNYSYPLPIIKLDFSTSPPRSINYRDNPNFIFRVTKPNRTFDNIILPETTKQQLEMVVTLSRKQKLIFDDWGMGNALGGLTHFAVNFYGPSGTGKTLAAEALASEIDIGFLRVSYAQLESKFVGETPKNIESVFDAAEKEGALLFFDEADSFLGKRVTEVNQSADYAVNVTRSVMLMRLETFKGIVVFATNLIRNYDPAFTRRLPLMVRFGLPDTPWLREAIWKVHIPEKLPLASDVDFGRLAEEFPEVSGGDIRNAVLMAVLKKASGSGPDSNKKISYKDFQESMRQILQGKRAILSQQEDKGIISTDSPKTAIAGSPMINPQEKLPEQ
jgi:SpoVK/Ycf46/Vps4 family AAA+-type ATPase